MYPKTQHVWRIRKRAAKHTWAPRLFRCFCALTRTEKCEQLFRRVVRDRWSLGDKHPRNGRFLNISTRKSHSIQSSHWTPKPKSLNPLVECHTMMDTGPEYERVIHTYIFFLRSVLSIYACVLQLCLLLHIIFFGQRLEHCIALNVNCCLQN